MSATPHTGHPIRPAHEKTRTVSIDARWPTSLVWQALILIAVAAAYFAAAKLGFAFAFIHTHVSPIWPPTGVAIAAVLLFGYRVAPAVLIGALLANANGPVPFAAASAIAVGNTLEAIVARWLLQTLKFHHSFGRARDVFKFVMAALVCTLISATIGVVALSATGAATWDQFGSLWVTWWLGDVAGAVAVAPLFIAWANHLGIELKGWRLVETVLLVLLVSVAAFVTYSERAPAALHYYPLTRLIVPVLLWASFRLGYRGLTLAIFLVTMFAAWGTVSGSGPFVSVRANESLVVLQLFISSNAVTFLFLTSVLEERRRAEASRRLDQQQLAANLEITRILAEAPPLDAAINRILKSIGDYLGWQIGAMWMPDSEKNVLRCLTVWRRDVTAPSPFEIESWEREFSPGVGLPGRIWEQRKAVWVEDVVTDDNFPRAPFAAQEGLHSAFAFPILAGDKFLGVIEFFSAEIREPDGALLQMFQSVGSQIGQFIERRHAEESLRGRETELQLITETTPLMLTRCSSKDLTYVFANRAYANMVGLEQKEIIGKRIVDIIGSDGLAAIQPYVDRVLAGEQIEYEQEVNFKTAGTRFLRGVYRPHKDRSGAIVGWMASISDLTDRRRAEEAQRRTQKELNEVQRRTEKDLRLLASIVENTDEVIIGRDLDGLVTSWNAAAERLYGYTAEEMIGQPVSVLIPSDRGDEEDEFLMRLRQGERIDHHETVRRAKDGRLIPVSLTISPIKDASGAIIGFSKFARDITYQKIAEAEREALLKSEHAARAQAEEANGVKDEFLAVLSHELRTPLNAILGWAGLLRGGKLDEQHAARALEIVERNANAQSKLIEGVLDVSRIVSGKLQLDIRPLQVSTVIATAIDSIRPAADAKNMTLRVLVAEAEPLVLGDANRLQQVVWNLLSNAVKFSRAGGEITVGLRSNSHVEIFVQDNGEGIPQEFLPHVFDRFRQEDSSTTRKHGGLGLGLAIVRHLVELHGGSVVAESAGVGKGATFIVRLQAIAKGDEALLARAIGKHGEIDPKAVLTGVKILVVDDHEDGREVLAEMLSMCDAEVKVAGSAVEAIAALGEWRPQVIVSDISMPEVDGYTFIRRLREMEPHRDIPAIAVTAHALAEDRERALAAGFQNHLAKPIQLTELALSIASLTGNSRLERKTSTG